MWFSPDKLDKFSCFCILSIRFQHLFSPSFWEISQLVFKCRSSHSVVNERGGLTFVDVCRVCHLLANWRTRAAKAGSADR